MQRRFNVPPVDENDSTATHGDDALPGQPGPARFRTGELQVPRQLLDGEPTTELARAIRGVERARRLLRGRTRRLVDLLHHATCSPTTAGNKSSSEQPKKRA